SAARLGAGHATRSRFSSPSGSPSRISLRPTTWTARPASGASGRWSSSGGCAMAPLDRPSLDEIRAARERIAGSVLRTPLVRLNVEDAPAEIFLKLENLQPIGSFKLRGAGNAM